MNNYQFHNCLKNDECYACFNKLNIALSKCLELSKGSKHCYEVYKPELCWPYDDCSICINRLVRYANICNKKTPFNRVLCLMYDIKDCDNECYK
jgi:hypothetical protein